MTHILYEEWESARETLGVRILAYVVMPEHFHIVLWSEQGASVSNFLRRTLAGTARRMGQGELWKRRPRVVTTAKRSVLQVKVDYIHRNPVARELVSNPEEWEHSSFRQIVLGRSDVPFFCNNWDVVLG